MSLWVCLDCTTAFAVGVLRCPHCGSERSAEQGTAAAMGLHARGRVEVEEGSMPKITRHGGPSDRHDPPVGDSSERGEQPSAGSSGETSSPKPSQKPEPNVTPSPSRARKTGSRSAKARTAAPSARSTDGGPEAGTSQTGSADE